MFTDIKKIWQAWGQSSMLYTLWCDRNGLNSYRAFVLYSIENNEGLTQRKISEYTGLSKQTVNTVIRSLKSDGYVYLEQKTNNLKEKRVFLTESGRLYVKQSLSELHSIENRALDIMGKERVENMFNSITLFNAIFEKELGNKNND